jgi:uncharacterized protein
VNIKKIFNDPIYGFITIPFTIILELIEHPYFQRLRRIRQLGLTHLVYPGALHTRFHHALGCMYLMTQAIETIRAKGHHLSEEEAEALCIAILLHDIGHGPFSHALECSIVDGISHEEMTLLVMNQLNVEFSGRLSLAIDIFQNQHSKKYLHQLVSSQLDMDRLDYLNRDSFYTGVSEGVVGWDRIIKTLDVRNDQLVIESKGIYSIEKFIIARRLMYWQVYLHKTVLSAEMLLVNILKRAKVLAAGEAELFATPGFRDFLYNNYRMNDFSGDTSLLKKFLSLDDFDVFTSVKVWETHDDTVLSKLCRAMVKRQLLRTVLSDKPFDQLFVQKYIDRTASALQISPEEAAYFVFSGTIENNAYDLTEAKINILFKDDTIKEIVDTSDSLGISALSFSVKKHYLCFPKESFS